MLISEEFINHPDLVDAVLLIYQGNCHVVLAIAETWAETEGCSGRSNTLDDRIVVR
jgi:hypothetical protein